MSLKLGGLPSLSYLGVEASQPPQLLYFTTRAPVVSGDYLNQNPGTLWLYVNGATIQLWMLISVVPTASTKWVLLYPASGSGASSFFTDDGNTATPNMGVLDVFGDSNITTKSPGSANEVQVTLNNSVSISGSFHAGTTITAGTGITNTTGNIVNSAGNIVNTGNLTSTGTTTLSQLGGHGTGVVGVSNTGVLSFASAGGASVQTLTGNSGGAVSPTVGGTINVIGDGTTATVVGNPGTNTLTISTIGSSGSFVLLSTVTANTSAVVFTGLTAYSTYYLTWSNLSCTAVVSDKVFWYMKLSNNNGFTYSITPVSTGWLSPTNLNTAGPGFGIPGANAYSVNIFPSGNMTMSGLNNATAGSFSYVGVETAYDTSGSSPTMAYSTYGGYSRTASINAIQFKPASGNWATGTFSLYGLVQ